MVTLEQAAVIIKRNLIGGVINAAIQWEDDWVFSVYTDDPDEGELDPFYAVNSVTGEFSGYSIIGDKDTSAILDAFNAVIEHGDTSGGFLAHYGVKGMRWGVRNDTSSGKASPASATKSGPSKASRNVEKGLNYIKPVLGPVIPRANITSKLIQIGSAVAEGQATKMALTSAAFSPLAIAGYAVTGLDSGAYRVPVVATQNLIRGGFNKNPELAKPNLSVSELQSKVVSQINKDFPGLGTTNNCLRCTYNYEMRRRGYDVAATKTLLASGQTQFGPMVMTKSLSSKSKIKNSSNPKGIKGFLFGQPPRAKDVFDTLSKQPDRSRGDLQMSWGTFLGGHSVAYEIVNGKPVIFDTQSGKTYSTPAELNKMTARAQGLSFNRLDDKKLNTTALTAWAKDSN